MADFAAHLLSLEISFDMFRLSLLPVFENFWVRNHTRDGYLTAGSRHRQS